MAFVFPENKADFLAPNGVTYSWDGTKWVTKTFKADESALEDYVKTEAFEADQSRQDDAFEADQTRQDDAFAAGQEAQDLAASELTERVSDGEVKQRQIELALEELSVTKGSVARYTVTETHIGAAIRNGELYVSSPNAADVQAISFAPFDTNGQPTRPANTGDIIEFVEVVRDVGQVTRYRIVDGGDSQALVVDYISGDNDFVKGENEEVYIYPQNEEGVSKEYVDGLDEQNVKLGAVNDVSVGFRIKNSGNTLISAATEGELGLYHVKDPSDGNESWAANKGYVDDNFINIAGQTDLDSQVFKIRQPNSEGAFRSFINIHNGDMNLYNVVDPSGAGHERWAATKGYVDDQAVVNKEYAEGHFAEKSHTHDYKKAALWKAVSPSTAAGDLQEGEFFVADNNNIYLHPKSANSIDLGISGTTEYSQSMTYIASIHGRGTYNSMYSTVADKINFNVSSNNYIRVQSSHLLYKQGFSVGTQYVINIPGFTP